MNRYELIDKSRSHLGAAEGSANTNDHEHYAEHMQLLLDLLIEELVASPPSAEQPPAKRFNPESILADIAISIAHRPISHTHRWKIIFYHERTCCVPAYADVPSQIVLHEFTERMVHRGFTSIYWNQLKQNVIKLYKELHK